MLQLMRKDCSYTYPPLSIDSIFSVGSTVEQTAQVAYKCYCGLVVAASQHMFTSVHCTTAYLADDPKVNKSGSFSSWTDAPAVVSVILQQLACHPTLGVGGSLRILPFTEATFNCSYLLDLFKRLR